jgi:hypothetical protein
VMRRDRTRRGHRLHQGTDRVQRVKHPPHDTRPHGSPAAWDEFVGVPCSAVPRAVSVPAVDLPHRWTAGVRVRAGSSRAFACRASPLRLHRLWTALWTSPSWAAGSVGRP